MHQGRYQAARLMKRSDGFMSEIVAKAILKSYTLLEHFTVRWKAGVIWMVALLLVAVVWTSLQVMRGLSYVGLVDLSGLLLLTGDWSLAKGALPRRVRA